VNKKAKSLEESKKGAGTSKTKKLLDYFLW
jgi:hypothetical protein